jgi:histidinol-phosphate/aromatic aminotransferase/cobyric acid decarboxylase-like protein
MNIYDYAAERKISIRRVLDFTLATNALGPSNKAKNAIRKALKTVALFPDPRTRYLKNYISRTEQAGEENILFGHGSSQLLAALLTTYAPERLLVPSPVPRHYAALLAGHSGTVVPIPIRADNGFRLDIDELASRFHEADAVLIPNPHLMVGTFVPFAGILEIISRIEASGPLLVIDEAYREFAREPSPVADVIRSGRTVILRSFSLFHGLAGLPLGYAIGGADIIRRVKEIVGSETVSTLAAAGANASLRDTAYHRRTEAYVKQEKLYLSGKLSRTKTVNVFDTACNFLLVKTEQPAADMERLFLERNILIEAFEEGSGSSFIRLPIRTHRENARFARVLSRVAGS